MNRSNYKTIPKYRFSEFDNTNEWFLTPFHELVNYERPEPYIVCDTNYQDFGTPVLTANKSFVLGYTNEDFGIYKNIPVIIFDDFTIDKKYVDFPFKVKSSAIKILKAKNENDPKFIYELMNTIRFTPEEHKRYYISVYQDILVFIPKNINEQKKIADCLSSLDELIEAENKKMEVLQKHKKGLMQKMFPTEGKSVPEWRFPEFKNNHKWNKIKIGDVGEVITGKTPATSDKTLWNGSIQFVTPTDITDSKYQIKTERTVADNVKGKILPPHSIMFTCIASIGKMAISVFPCITNQQINSIIPYDLYCNEYVYYTLLRKSVEIKKTMSNTTLPIINKTEFSDILLDFPDDIKEQQKIADCLSQIDNLILSQSQKIDKLKEHKKGLIQGLFPSVDEVYI